jgi:hypothetical protein
MALIVLNGRSRFRPIRDMLCEAYRTRTSSTFIQGDRVAGSMAEKSAQPHGRI